MFHKHRDLRSILFVIEDGGTAPAQKEYNRDSTLKLVVNSRWLLMTLERITTRPEICGGKPCIRGLRFPVSRLLGLLAAGETPEQILRAYPYLEEGDIRAALHYAAALADEQIIELA
jgi:uncharacterized protein (DUF433 family)